MFKPRFWAVAALLTHTLPVAAAQPSFWDNIAFRGVASVETAVEFESVRFQKTDFSIEPELEFDLRDWGRITAIGRLRFDASDRLEPGGSPGQDVRSPQSRRLFIGQHGDAELRELYWDFDVGNSYVRLGKQQVVWGQADGLRVLDVVNPLDFREWILGDLEDRRIPTWMANVEIPVGDLNIQLLWVPDHSYDDLPDFDGRFGLTSPIFVPRPPEGLVLTAAPLITSVDRPDRLIRDDDYGVRLSGFFGGWDLSLNYFYHYQDQQVLERRFLTPTEVLIAPGYERTHLIGASASNSFGKATLRAEFGYSSDRFFLDSSVDDGDGLFETAVFESVLGLDYPVDSDLFLSVQLFQSALLHKPETATRSRLENTATALVTQDFLNDALRFKTQLIHSLDRHDGQWEFGFEYDFRSNLVLKAGIDIFYGENEGLFGQFDNRDRITFGIDYSF